MFLFRGKQWSLLCKDTTSSKHCVCIWKLCKAGQGWLRLIILCWGPRPKLKKQKHNRLKLWPQMNMYMYHKYTCTSLPPSLPHISLLFQVLGILPLYRSKTSHLEQVNIRTLEKPCLDPGKDCGMMDSSGVFNVYVFNLCCSCKTGLITIIAVIDWISKPERFGIPFNCLVVKVFSQAVSKLNSVSFLACFLEDCSD